MAEKRSKGIIKPFGEEFSRPLKDADSLDDSGYVLTIVVEGGVNKVGKAAAADFPYAVNTKSTRDRLDIAEPPAVFLQGDNARLDTVDVVDEGEIGLKVAANNAAIKEGEPLVVAAAGGGKVDKYTPTVVAALADTVTRFQELAKIVAYAREDIAEGSGGNPGEDKVHAKLTIKNVPVIA